MDTRLKELLDLHANGMAEELQAIEPILRKIAEDDGMMHVARLEAKQLLKSAKPDVSTAKPIGSATLKILPTARSHADFRQLRIKTVLNRYRTEVA